MAAERSLNVDNCNYGAFSAIIPAYIYSQSPNNNCIKDQRERLYCCSSTAAPPDTLLQMSKFICQLYMQNNFTVRSLVRINYWPANNAKPMIPTSSTYYTYLLKIYALSLPYWRPPRTAFSFCCRFVEGKFSFSANETLSPTILPSTIHYATN